MEAPQVRTALALLTASALAAAAVAAIVVGISSGGGDDESTAECEAALTVPDAPRDVYESPRLEDSAPIDLPSADLLDVAVGAEESGICVQWTTAAPAPVGTLLVFGATGPYVEVGEGQGSQAFGYGFHVELSETDGRVIDTSEPEGLGLRARVSRSGSSVSLFVPQSEIAEDRSFPHERFSFKTSLLSPPGAEQYSDSLPQSGRPDVGYLDGELCPAPCGDLRLDASPVPPGAPEQSLADVAGAADEICRRTRSRLEDLERPRTRRALVQYASQAWPIMSSALADLRALAPPPPWDDFLGFVELRSLKLEELESVAPTDEFTPRTLAADVDELGRRAELELRDLGATECEDIGIPPLAPPLGGRPPGF